jgi:hypothetical protein
MTKPKAKPLIAATPPQKFNELLTWHIANGTRPDRRGEPGKSWRSDFLAIATRCNAASIRNWRRGRSMPGARHVDGLAVAFFGSNPSLKEARSVFLESWRFGLAAHQSKNMQRSIGELYKGGAPQAGKAARDDIRNYVILQLSALCQALNIPLSGVEGATDYLLRTL